MLEPTICDLCYPFACVDTSSRETRGPVAPVWSGHGRWSPDCARIQSLRRVLYTQKNLNLDNQGLHGYWQHPPSFRTKLPGCRLRSSDLLPAAFLPGRDVRMGFHVSALLRP